MTGTAIVLLRAPIALMILGCLLVEGFFLPLLAWEAADEMPEMAHLAVPYTVLAILSVICVQVALVAVWGLLTMVQYGQIFTRKAVGRVNLIIGCGAIATLLSLAVALHLFLVVGAGGPPIVALFLGGCVVAGATFTLLMTVMRGLLRSAGAMRSELDLAAMDAVPA